jgi:hypothetical protein
MRLIREDEIKTVLAFPRAKIRNLRDAFVSSHKSSRSLLQMLTEAGFVGATIHGWTGYHTSSCTEGVLVMAQKPEAIPHKA